LRTPNKKAAGIPKTATTPKISLWDMNAIIKLIVANAHTPIELIARYFSP